MEQQVLPLSAQQLLPPSQEQYDPFLKQRKPQQALTIPTSSVSDELQTNDDPNDDLHENGIKFVDWGFKVDRLFEVAHRFYKRNESKAFHPTFDIRNQMNALILQARYGNFDGVKAPDVGAFDLIGKSRRHEWSLLKGMSKTEAMSKFIYTLDEICPFFKAHAEAVKISSNLNQANMNSDNSSSFSSPSLNPNDDKHHQQDSTNVSNSSTNGSPRQQNSSNLTKEEVDDQLNAIRTSLNRQTYEQFKCYADKQYPDDKAQRKSLIMTLQDQYYQQYISQMQPKLVQQSKDKSSEKQTNVTDTYSQTLSQEGVARSNGLTPPQSTQEKQPTSLASNTNIPPKYIPQEQNVQNTGQKSGHLEPQKESKPFNHNNMISTRQTDLITSTNDQKIQSSHLLTNENNYEPNISDRLNSLNISPKQQISPPVQNGIDNNIESGASPQCQYLDNTVEVNFNKNITDYNYNQQPISTNIAQPEQKIYSSNNLITTTNAYQQPYPYQTAGVLNQQNTSAQYSNAKTSVIHQDPQTLTNLPYQYQYDIEPRDIGRFESFPEPTLIQNPTIQASTPLSFAINMFSSMTNSNDVQPPQVPHQKPIESDSDPPLPPPPSPPPTSEVTPSATTNEGNSPPARSDLAEKKFYEPEIFNGAKEINSLPQLPIPFQPLPTPPLASPIQQPETRVYNYPSTETVLQPPASAGIAAPEAPTINTGYENPTHNYITNETPYHNNHSQAVGHTHINHQYDYYIEQQTQQTYQHPNLGTKDSWAPQESPAMAHSPVIQQTADVTYGQLEPASIRTKKGVIEFRETLMDDKHGGVHVVNQGSLLIIQVPTYPDGRYMQFEFCSEDYDVAFGLDFVYEPYLQEPLEMRIYEDVDSDDDEEYGEDGGEDSGAYDGEINHFDYTNDTELAMAAAHRRLELNNQRKKFFEKKRAAKIEKATNTITIVPTYRRDSHQEVYIGRHRYPGQGYYLLKFDNTYSVLRSKTIFFRICYLI